MAQQRVAVLTGAGISAESGVRTFRDGDGLWEEHHIEDVATPQAWIADPVLVWRFYQARRRQLFEVEPNAAHQALATFATKIDNFTLATVPGCVSHFDTLFFIQRPKGHERRVLDVGLLQAAHRKPFYDFIPHKGARINRRHGNITIKKTTYHVLVAVGTDTQLG